MSTNAISSFPFAQSNTNSAVANTDSTDDSSSDDSSSLSADNLGTTFLQLLITELKCQDPLSPMDSTQMVGQMISLNQLSQLVGISDTLDTITGN